MSTPVRNWLRKKLIETIPVGTIWSDKDTKEKHPFQDLTGMTHKGLLKKWYELDSDEKIIENTFGTDPKFTTCSSFLPIMASKIRIAGGMPTTKHNNYTGKEDPIGLRGFQLHTERGWTPAFLGYAVNGGPKEGDFFQLVSKSGMTEHVGIILTIKGDLWSAVAGGAGGRGSRHDGVSRSILKPRPQNLMGWIDIDAYFQGWNGPDVGEVVDSGQTNAAY